MKSDWNDESASSHRTPGTTRGWKMQKPAPRPRRTRAPCTHPAEGLLASRTGREQLVVEATQFVVTAAAATRNEYSLDT